MRVLIALIVLHLAVGVVLNGFVNDGQDEFSKLLMVGWPLFLIVATVFLIAEKLFQFGQWIRTIFNREN